MTFKREIRTEYISESDNVWIDNPFKETDGKEKIQIVGTRVICKVTEEKTGFHRLTSYVLAPQYSIDDKENRDLIEQNFLICERHLKEVLSSRKNFMEALQSKKDALESILENEKMNQFRDELRANNII